MLISVLFIIALWVELWNAIRQLNIPPLIDIIVQHIHLPTQPPPPPPSLMQCRLRIREQGQSVYCNNCYLSRNTNVDICGVLKGHGHEIRMT